MPMPRLSPEQQPDSHILPADYESPCAVCHRPIRPGDKIIHSWRPYELNAHSRCTTQEELEGITKPVEVEFSVWPGLIFCDPDDESWYRVIATRYPNYLPPDKRQPKKQAKKGKAKKQDAEPLQDITSICYLRPATPSEIAATQEKFYRTSRRDGAQEKRREIAREIREQGESVEDWARDGERLLEQNDSFGGYSYFALDGEYVFYVKSTGRDGHIPEGVEIAWRVEADEEFRKGLCELAAALSPNSN